MASGIVLSSGIEEAHATAKKVAWSLATHSIDNI